MAPSGYTPRELAERLGVSEKTVQGLNAELRRHGAIETRGQGTGKPLRYLMLGFTIAAAASSALAQASSVLLISGYSPESRSEGPGPRKTTTQSLLGVRNLAVRIVAGFFPHPLPTREYLNNTHASREALSPDECVLLEKLKRHGVAAGVAEDLVRKFPDRIEPQLLALRFRSNIRGVAPFVVKAIAEDYPMPVRQQAIRDRVDAAPPVVEPKLTREEKMHLDADAQRATDAMLAALPAEIKYLIGLRVEEHLASGIWARLNAETKRKIRRAKQVSLAEEFLLTGEVPA